MLICVRMAWLLAALVLTSCVPVNGGRWWEDRELVCWVIIDPCFPHAVEVQHL